MDPQEKVRNLRHTLSHVLAHAVLNLYGPKVKFGIGPVIESGFYYDFEFPKPISDADLPKIEEEMQRLIKKNLEMKQETHHLAQALDMMKKAGQTFKEELLKEIQKGEREKVKGVKKGEVSFYRLGDFLDLCKGGHIKNTSEIPQDSFKLLNLAGAYWKGSEQNPMLTRIYAAAFTTKKELDEYLKLVEEAKKRDHKKLGPKLELFIFHETSPGMPYWLPKGVIIYNELVNFWRQEHRARRYQEIVSPLLNKKELYVTSGHFEHYWQDMFVVKSVEGVEYGVKAMNCPNAMVVFGSKLRSYKDLPLRLSDTDTLHRDELSGTLNGLLRVREFRQDDAHIFVTEEQIGEEYERIFEIVERFYSLFEMSYTFRLGTRPEKFLGDAKTWGKAEDTLKIILKKSGKKFTIEEKEGAFYGPKVDILMKDALGRDWQMGTIQLDFQQPRRFKLEYIDAKGKKQTPIAIHRVIYGSLERFIGILIEHFAGAFPLWLAPVQVAILPISDELNDYAQKIVSDLRFKIYDLRIEVDQRSESVGRKIREAELQKIPYMLIVGKKEKETGTISVRQRGEKDLGVMKIDKFAEKITKEIETKTPSLSPP
ncbi:MAG: threonine--tRNA ligase [Candidatus Doudnabacteria bacterium]|nr:threonine--tRNA ligase [Candidatus Doudnabacteria bacterium]